MKKIFVCLITFGMAASQCRADNNTIVSQENQGRQLNQKTYAARDSEFQYLFESAAHLSRLPFQPDFRDIIAFLFSPVHPDGR